jgi:hypothetical protein
VLADPGNSDREPVRFVMRRMRCGDGQFEWGQVSDPRRVRTILRRVMELEGKTWFDLQKADVSLHAHELSANRLSPEAEQAIADAKLDAEVDQLFQVGVSGKQRIIGLRYESEFHVVWWDPMHEFCPSKKKGT